VSTWYLVDIVSPEPDKKEEHKEAESSFRIKQKMKGKEESKKGLSEQTLFRILR
jgi:hypothetical protein